MADAGEQQEKAADAMLDLIVARVKQELLNPKVKYHVFPGGRKPERKTSGAVGFDAYARAIVSSEEMESDGIMRKTLFDFRNLPTDPVLRENHVVLLEDVSPEEECKYGYKLMPGEIVLVGLGVATSMPDGLVQDVRPRSGLALKHGIFLANGPGTIDPDFTGEGGALLFNRSNHPFTIRHHMRVCQLVFHPAVFPEFEEVLEHSELAATVRGTDGYGSTGHFG